MKKRDISRRDYLSLVAKGSILTGASTLIAGTSVEASSKAGISLGTTLSLDGPWLLATDPKNVGRDQEWWRKPVEGSVKTKVPWIIQDVFPGYHGVAWYWREGVAPASLDPEGRYLLRFWAVDYLANVWVNDLPVGSHEGGETPFVLDVTHAVKPKANTRVAVRVLNPTHERIGGITLPETPHRCKVMPYSAGAAFNHGGITDSVELLVRPGVRIEDLHVRPAAETGMVLVSANLRNATGRTTDVRWVCHIGTAASGEILDVTNVARELPLGDTHIETRLRVNDHRLWDLGDPFLYRVTAQVFADAYRSMDERSTNCGFRDFRFADGYFRLNGRRIFLRSSHTVNHYPIGLQFAHDPDLERRDLYNVKVMGFNMVRFIWGGAKRSQLDLCDEIGLMVYNESYASYPMEDSPHLEKRFDQSVTEVIRRDRNHPSVVIWGLLNENGDGRQFRHAVEILPIVRSLDPDRMVFLNSGRLDGQLNIGSVSNPGSPDWQFLLGGEQAGYPAVDGKEPQVILGKAPNGGIWRGRSIEQVGDAHLYSRVPQTTETTRAFRTLGQNSKHIFLTEYGIGSAVDLWRTVRHFERLNKARLEDGQFYKDKLDLFLADYKRWNLVECFAHPMDFFLASLGKMAGQRSLGLNAIRSNPHLVGYSLTGMIDHVMTGEGLTTPFRELKPGTIDTIFDCWAPLRLCLFVEPQNVFRGKPVKLEAVLANEDVLVPGEYSIHLRVDGPNNFRVFERNITTRIPDRQDGREPDLAMPLFSEEVVINGPSGEYRFAAVFEKGAAASGGEATFHVTDVSDLPSVSAEVVLWGNDPELEKWLSSHNIRNRPFDMGKSTSCELILISNHPHPGGAEAFRELARRIAQGSTAIFLSQQVFARGNQPLGWLPLANKGTPAFLDKPFYDEPLTSWLYLKDEWAKKHPFFEGLPAGGLMNYNFYGEVIPDAVWVGQDPPRQAVAGAIKASQDYSSGLMVSVYNMGSGQFILNTLLIRENLGKHPAAEIILLNMLRSGGRDIKKRPADLPLNFNEELKKIGYV